MGYTEFGATFELSELKVSFGQLGAGPVFHGPLRSIGMFFAERSSAQSDRIEFMSSSPPQPDESQPLVEGLDYYMDGPYLVFTEAYHRKRGYCCQSGCRHCPWRSIAMEDEM